MRVTGEALLDDFGYEVVLAVNGLEALEIYKKEKGAFDLVILSSGFIRKPYHGAELSQIVSQVTKEK